MDQREKSTDREEALRVAISSMLLDVQTITPVLIQSYDPASNTCVAQPAIQSQVESQNGVFTWTTLPLIIRAPLVRIKGGQFFVDCEPAAGDEALALFSSRAIDNWFLRGGVQQQHELRSHSISDGFILAGVQSLPHVIQTMGQGIALRNASGDTAIQVGLAGTVTIKAPQTLALEVPIDPGIGGPGIIVTIGGVRYRIALTPV